MKRIPIFPHQPEVVDVEDVKDLGRRPWFRSPRLTSGLLLALIALAAIAWWTYAVYLKPGRDRQLVDEATKILLASPDMSEWSGFTRGETDEQKLITLSELFLEEDLGVPPTVGLKAGRAALDLAIQSGSKEARLTLGEFLRDGKFGQKDSKAALAQFQIVLNEIQTGIQAGDHGSLYVYSLMLKEGLGVEADPAGAREILQRVALSLGHATMDSIARSISLYRENKLDIELVRNISLKLVREGFLAGWERGFQACDAQGPRGEHELFEKLMNANDLDGIGRLQDREMRAARRHEEDCFRKFGEPAASRGDKEAVAYLAKLASDGQQAVGERRVARGFSEESADPETQSRTGYLKGVKQIAKGGLSTFKVDNTKGGGDAVVRLYRDGKKPAARSMFVKNGESFTADAIAPGAYRLRYRYIGSGDTYEAEETFALSETATDTGTRFSRVTVTLYKVANGNMTVKKVDANEF